MQAARQVPTAGRPRLATAAAPRTTACRGRRASVHVAAALFRQLDCGAWVVHTRTARKPRAVVHFLGGAFAGAAPQVAYHLTLELLADAGLTVIATPYQLTFKHLDCAAAVAANFTAALAELRTSGRSYLAPAGAPVVGVGHSNGALLHLLIGALTPGHADANVLVSYNNKQVSDAVPIPGLLDSLRPTVAAARGAPAPLPPAAAVVASLASALPPGVAIERRLVEAAVPAVEQLGSVLGEVGDGVTEFTPTPEESRALIAAGYRVRRSLLLQFEDDSIDQSDEMAALLASALQGSSSSSASGSATSADGSANGGSNAASASGGEAASSSGGGGGREDAGVMSSGGGSVTSSGEEYQWGGASGRRSDGGWGGDYGGGGGYNYQSVAGPLQPVRLLRLPGNHVTPCGADFDFGPASALTALQRARADAQADARRLAGEVAAWVKAVAAEERARRRGGGAAPGGAAAAAAAAPPQGAAAS